MQKQDVNLHEYGPVAIDAELHIQLKHRPWITRMSLHEQCINKLTINPKPSTHSPNLIPQAILPLKAADPKVPPPPRSPRKEEHSGPVEVYHEMLMFMLPLPMAL